MRTEQFRHILRALRRPRRYLVVAAAVAALVGLSVWLRAAATPTPAPEIAAAPEFDYYLADFVAVGVDRRGAKYRVQAERMTHFPHTGRAKLRRPRIVQYRADGGAQHIQADSGWLYDNGAEALLEGNVRVTELGDGRADASVARSERMRIRLR